GIRDFHVTGVQTCALPIWIGILRANLFELRTDDAEQTLRPRKDVSEILDLFEERLELLPDLVLLQSGEAVQPEIEDGLRLNVGQMIAVLFQTERVEQPIRPSCDLTCSLEHLRNGTGWPRAARRRDLRVGRGRRRLDERDHLVEVRERDRLTFEDVGTLSGLA